MVRLRISKASTSRARCAAPVWILSLRLRNSCSSSISSSGSCGNSRPMMTSHNYTHGHPTSSHCATISLNMTKLLLLVAVLCYPLHGAKPVLIVSDGAPIRILAVQLKAHGIQSETVGEDAIPGNLSSYPAVLIYVHSVLAGPAEKAFMAYANAGGKLIVLHHSISSQKRQNPNWMAFLGVKLPEGDVSEGGYKFYDPVNLTLVNLAPKDWITTHDVHWESRAE